MHGMQNPACQKLKKIKISDIADLSGTISEINLRYLQNV